MAMAGAGNMGGILPMCPLMTLTTLSRMSQISRILQKSMRKRISRFLIGIVHRQRKLAGKRNAAVFGIATDSEEFRFWRIDNDGEVRKKFFLSRSSALVMVLTEIEIRKSPAMDRDTRSGEIISFIRRIIRVAIVESPMTTPYNGYISDARCPCQGD
jgi:hypothetical protein